MKDRSYSGSKTVKMNLLVPAFFLLFFPFTQFAQWKNLNPISGLDVTSTANLGNEIFIGTPGKGIYHSIDDGNLWSQFNAGLTDFNITTLLNANGSMLAGTKYAGIFKLKVKNWSPVNICNCDGATVYSLGICGTKTYAGVNNSIYQSADYGTTWRKIKDFGFDTTVTSFAFSCCTVFAGTNANAVFTSADSGATWNRMKNSPPSINAMIVHNGFLYAGTDLGMFYSNANNLNGSWQNLGGFYIPVASITPLGNDLLVGTKGYGVIKYSEPNWLTANAGIYDKWVSAIIVSGQNIFIGTKKYGVYKSTDNAGTWEAVNAGLFENSVRDMAMDGNKLFVLMNNDNGIYNTTDNGNTWQSMSNGLKSFKGFTFLAKYNGQLFAGGLNGFYQTPVTSVQWMKSTLNKTVSYLLADGRNYFAGAVDSFDETLVYYSNDSGATWNSTHVMAFGYVNNFHKTGTRMLAGHQSSGVLISDDGGKSWTENNWGLDDASSKNVWKIAESTNYLFVATHGSVYRALKAVTPYKWQKVAFFNTDIYDMLVTNGDTIYVAPYGQGVYASSNDGDVWWSENDGLLDLNIISLAESGGGKIYCSSLTSGIYSRDKFTITSVENESPKIPSNAILFQNYPNPFNPSTVISYQLSATSMVSLKIYDVLGREITTLVNEIKAPGIYEIQFNTESLAGNSLPSGIYFYQLRAGSFVQTRKMILMK